MTDNESLFLEARGAVGDIDIDFSARRCELNEKKFIIDQIPIDDPLPPTPTRTGYVENKEIPTAAKFLIAYNIGVGLFPVVYEGENDGHLIRHVVPRNGFDRKVSSHGASISFMPHSDNPDLYIPGERHYGTSASSPKTLSLLTLRKQEGVYTSLIKLSDVLEDVPKKHITKLLSNEFSVTRPESFDGEHVTVNKVPVLSVGDDCELVSRYDFHNVKPLTDAAASSLKVFEKSVMDREKWCNLSLEPGQVLIFDNHKTLHTRNAFVPKGNGEERWLIRVFGVEYKIPEGLIAANNCSHHIKTTS